MMSITEEMQDELLALAERHGGHCPAEALIEHAKNSNAWYPAFSWDDKIAGHQYRLIQARGYIARVKYIPAESAEPIRAFAQFSEVNEDGYMSTADILADIDERAKLIRTLINRHLGIYKSYQLEEFAWLKEGLDKMLAQFERREAA